jgi:hypothetical protein
MKPYHMVMSLQEFYRIKYTKKLVNELNKRNPSTKIIMYIENILGITYYKS